MKISAIMPSHNRQPYIETAIRSLLQQRESADLDIIVVDDGSTDNTAAVVEKIAAQDAAVRLIRQAHSGVAVARNTGLDNIHPDAELVTFLDSDDAAAPDRFAHELGHFVDAPQLAMTYGLMTLALTIDDKTLTPPPRASTCTIRGISLTAAVFRRAAIEKVGRFDETLRQSEDFDFLLRFFELGLDYRLLDNVSIFYRRHIGNMTKDREESQKFLLRSLILSARRRQRDGVVKEIPKFFDIHGMFAAENALLR